MEAKKEFLRMINECDEIALATSIHDIPNVRIVNYYYDQDNNIMYFAYTVLLIINLIIGGIICFIS